MANEGNSSGKKILIAGAGGHGRAVAEAIERRGTYQIVGFLDDRYPVETQVWHYPILGTLGEVGNFIGVADALVVAIGNNQVRQRIYTLAKASGFALPSIIHPVACVSSRAEIADGCTIMADAIIGTEAILGQGCVVNINASVDHHCELGDFVHLGVGVQLAGGVKVGEAALMHAGSSAGYGVEVPASEVITSGVGLTL
jgi:sugar O-acyltransferase (sialic acid O-acetyltransferase NeuD family)